MARRADKYKRLVWLQALPTDPQGHDKLVSGHSPDKYGTYIDLLTGGYGLWLEMEKDGDGYSLRCYPRHLHGGISKARICASYKGPSLGRLLVVASEDYREYINAPGEATLSPFERVRYVS